MKTHITYSLLAAAAACGSVFGAATAYTTPVGYVSATIAGGSLANPGSTFITTPLVQSNSFVGVSSNAPSGTKIISTTATLPVGLDSLYYVEITSGASEGWWSTIASVSGGNVTVADNFPSGLAIGTNFAIRKHTTLKSFLGSNAPGLDPGLSLDDADEVQLLNAFTQSASSYFYALAADGAPVDGWYDGGGNSADDVLVLPGSSALVKRKQAGNVTFTTSGTVKTTKTQVDVFPGDNWVSTMRATGITLAAMNLDTGNTSTGVQQGSDLSVDEIQISNLAQVTSAYFAADPVATGVSGWYDGGGNPADTVSIAETQGAVLKRKLVSPAIWTVPAITIAP